MNLWLWVILIVMILAGLWFLIGLVYSVGGDWVRQADDGPGVYLPKETLQLAQFGPLVIGKRELLGGKQRFFGWMLGRKLWLKRRDYGEQANMRQGFPAQIARELEGAVMGRLSLRLSKDACVLRGKFQPYRVEFMTKPAQVTAIRPQPKVPRVYRKVEQVPATEVAQADAVPE